jgi:hypothetical protein
VVDQGIGLDEVALSARLLPFTGQYLARPVLHPSVLWIYTYPFPNPDAPLFPIDAIVPYTHPFPSGYLVEPDS